MKLLLDVIPEASVDDRRDALIRASKYALMRGVTMVVDVGRYFPGETVDHVWKDLSGNDYMELHSCAKLCNFNHLCWAI